MANTNMFNFRVDDDMDIAIEESAGAAGLKKSVWAREVLGAVALGGVTLEQLADLVQANGKQGESPHPERFLTVQGQVGRKDRNPDCIHPLTARKRMPFTIICGICKTVVKHT
jgi:hypothetical protein